MTSETGVTTWVDVDEQGRYVDAGLEALEAFGVPLDELRRRRVGDFAPHGLGPIHRALFLWLVRHGRDFGGGESTIAGADGRMTPIRCTSIDRIGDRYRLALTIESGEPVPPHSHALASVLDAWREAERDLSGGPSDPDYDLARTVAASLRDIYQFVVSEKTANPEVDDSADSRDA